MKLTQVLNEEGLTEFRITCTEEELKEFVDTIQKNEPHIEVIDGARTLGHYIESSLLDGPKALADDAWFACAVGIGDLVPEEDEENCFKEKKNKY